MATDTHIAVLTGDLVASTALGNDKIAQAFEALEACAATQAGWFGAPLHFTRHRGDGWQVVLARPECALRSALAFRAALKARDGALDSYISIAEGDAPDRIGDDLNSHSEKVFVDSGHGLDELKDTATPLRIIHASLGAYDAATILADHLSQDWTQAQATAILPTLAPDFDLNYTTLGKSLGKSRQAVTKALSSAGHDFLSLALETLEQEKRRA